MKPMHSIAFLLLLAAVRCTVANAQEAEASPHALCDAHAERILDALGTKDYEAAAREFGPALQTQYPAAKLRQDNESLPASYGRLLGRGRPHSTGVGEQTVVMAPLIFERGTLTVETHCGSDGRVMLFKLLPTQRMTE